MADKLPKISITYKGIFDFGDIYGLIHDFLKDKEYTGKDFAGQGPKDMYEFEYIEKGDVAKQYQIKWEAKKEDESFFTAKVNVKFEGKNIAKTEIMHEGVKVKVDNGEISIEIESEFDTNYDKATKEHPFVKHFKSKFERMMRDIKKGYKKSLEGDMEELHNLMKRYFKMKGDKVVASVAPVRKG
jgi:hypothetical protein